MAKKNKNRKTPKAGADVKLRKRPVPGPVGAPASDARLVFGLQLLDHAGPWPWAEVAAAHIQTIAQKCKGWESMRPAEVFGASGNKPIPAENMCADARKRLVEIRLDDHDGLWELRLSGKHRIWGILDRNVFYPVWWDPEHEVCPAAKRRT